MIVLLDMDNVEIEIPQKYLDVFKKNTENKIGFSETLTY